MKIYHLKNCDTCRKAIKALCEAGFTPELIDVRADGLTSEQLDHLEGVFGYESMLNTRSTSWRALDAEDKHNITRDKALSLIAQHPTLLKRPAILDGDKHSLGWTQAAQDIWL